MSMSEQTKERLRRNSERRKALTLKATPPEAFLTVLDTLEERGLDVSGAHGWSLLKLASDAQIDALRSRLPHKYIPVSTYAGGGCVGERWAYLFPRLALRAVLTELGMVGPKGVKYISKLYWNDRQRIGPTLPPTGRG